MERIYYAEPDLAEAMGFARDTIILARLIDTDETRELARAALRMLRAEIALEKRGLEFGLIDLGGEGG